MKPISPLLALGWLAACFVLFAAVSLIYFDLNVFDWNPKWDWGIPVCGIGALASITAIWFLGRATRDWFSFVLSLFLCLLLAGFALLFLPAEPIVPKGAWFSGRHSTSPWWFRISLAILMVLPAVFWFVGWLLRHRRRP